MFEVSKVDKNFKIESKINIDDICFHSVEESPFKVCGIFKENGKYRRMPEAVARNVSEGVYTLHTNTAGGRVRFMTDSPYIAVHADMDSLCKIPHFSLTGSAAFDLYAEKRFIKTFIPPYEAETGYESVIKFENALEREITIDFPLYSNVRDLYIGLKEGASLREAKPYKNKKPIVYYGSSITQGGCASRPGMSYPAIISRMFDYDYINLGFSGSAKAEDEMAEYIASLDMSLFVYDYDHNAKTIECLAKTHEKMFQTIRKKQPQLPIVILPRPKYFLSEGEKKRRDIIETTYKNAAGAGDKNVYYIDCETLCEFCKGEGTVDNCHPTDLGFHSMAQALAALFNRITL